MESTSGILNSLHLTMEGVFVHHYAYGVCVLISQYEINNYTERIAYQLDWNVHLQSKHDSSIFIGICNLCIA